MQLDDNDPGCSHSVKTGAVTNEHFNEHTGFDFVVVVVVVAAAVYSLFLAVLGGPNLDKTN